MIAKKITEGLVRRIVVRDGEVTQVRQGELWPEDVDGLRAAWRSGKGQGVAIADFLDRMDVAFKVD